MQFHADRITLVIMGYRQRGKKISTAYLKRNIFFTPLMLGGNKCLKNYGNLI